MNKKDESRNGWIAPEVRTELISSISIAKGTLATLSLEHPSAWTRKYAKTPKEHLRILLQDIQTELHALEDRLETIPRTRPPHWTHI
jgi:hypothetical protein